MSGGDDSSGFFSSSSAAVVPASAALLLIGLSSYRFGARLNVGAAFISLLAARVDANLA